MSPLTIMGDSPMAILDKQKSPEETRNPFKEDNPMKLFDE